VAISTGQRNLSAVDPSSAPGGTNLAAIAAEIAKLKRVSSDKSRRIQG